MTARGGWLWRGLLALGAGVWAFALGAWLGGRYLVAPGQGLAAPAEALGYALVAALLAIALTLLVSARLGGGALRVSALAFVVGALGLVGWVAYRIDQAVEARRDPDSAYAGIPAFTARLSQIKIIDPYLRTEIRVDSAGREVVSIGPGPALQRCRGEIRAEALRRVADAIETLIATPDAAFDACRPAEAERRFSFVMADATAGGALEISRACLESVAPVAEMVRAMDRAPLDAASVRCE